MRTAFHKAIVRDKGVFNGRNLFISTDNVTWIHSHMLMITDHGQLFSADETGTPYLVLQSLQSCHVQILPDGGQIQLRRKGKIDETMDEPPVVLVRTYDNDKLYLKVLNRANFGNLIASLIVWQNLKPQGLAKKWYAENKASRSVITDASHEVLVCRCKVYGPIPTKSKNVKIVPGTPAPSYQPHTAEQDYVEQQSPLIPQIQEGWFYAMGALNSNGVLNFITELDGTLLYSINIKSIMSSEIREMHHSMFDNSNVLFIGKIKELRWNNCIKTVTPQHPDEPFLMKDGRPIQGCQRILIEFPLHIDLEDWFVGLNYFAKREYIGSYSQEQSRKPQLPMESQTSLETENTRILSNSNSSVSPPIETVATAPPPHLSEYPKDSLRVSKHVSIDIIEAKFDEQNESAKIYAEVVMWGFPWSRTAIVGHSLNPFWKEEFSTNLPISTQIVHILIKQCLGSTYSIQDKVIGTVYITPDILTKQLQTASTMMTSVGNGISVVGNNIGYVSAPTNDIVRLPIYDSANLPVGKLLLTVNLKEHHILNPRNFKTLENMLMNAPMKELIRFCNTNVPTSDFESVSLMMLDIFQSLGIEDMWFKSLMEAELVNIDRITRQNYVNKRNSGVPNVPTATRSTNNVFNTLFRGSSIFSKSLEKYNLRIGQEYLEKVFGEFFAKISREKKNCEVDPRYVKREMQSSDDESDIDEEEEEERERAVKFKVEENFDNLLKYADEIWHKIYITSNDLPQQIKVQLKNFRTKVELACDPEDKVTALNCLSAFIFLRFFCPAILNPKLFYLTKDHQTGESQRTLTLIAKILLNLANRADFSPHKEPHLVRMNQFLHEHREEVLDYFDRITGRKNDFHEKILDLSHEVKRFDLGLSESESSELPTTPYLIDKYLRLTQLIELLDFSGENSRSSTISKHSSIDSSQRQSYRESGSGPRDSGDIHINADRNVYQIGSLEFEKSEFLDLAGDNETEGFLKSLCRSNENIFSFITSNITLKDLQKQSTTLRGRIGTLEHFLEQCEYPKNFQFDSRMWESFAEDILSKAYLDTSKNTLVYCNFAEEYIPSHMKRLTDNALTGLKLKFPDQQHQEPETKSLVSQKSPNKNPFKKWLRAGGKK